MNHHGTKSPFFQHPILWQRDWFLRMCIGGKGLTWRSGWDRPLFVMIVFDASFCHKLFLDNSTKWIVHTILSHLLWLYLPQLLYSGNFFPGVNLWQFHPSSKWRRYIWPLKFIVLKYMHPFSSKHARYIHWHFYSQGTNKLYAWDNM